MLEVSAVFAIVHSKPCGSFNRRAAGIRPGGKDFSYRLIAAFGPFHPGTLIVFQPFFHNVIDRSAIQIDLPDHVSDGIIVNLKVAHRLIRTRPFFFAGLPSDLLNPAAGFAAVIGLPLVDAPAWIMIAFFSVAREFDPLTLKFDRCPMGGVNPA